MTLSPPHAASRPHGPAFQNPAVAEVFASYSEPEGTGLLSLRALIFATAARTEGVGDILETLKWGQPSYLTPATGSGSTIRIDRIRDRRGRYGIYFHCGTSLVETFRRLYSDRFEFIGNRCMVVDAGDADQQEPLCHCIALALTYHLRKSARKVEINAAPS